MLQASPQLDWERCLAQAHQLGGMRMLALGLSLAHALLGMSPPAAVGRRIQTEAVVPWLATQVRTGLFAAGARPPSAWDHPAFYLGLRDRLPCYLYLAYRAVLPGILRSRRGTGQAAQVEQR